MSGNICAYYNCGNSQRHFPTLKMHRFPAKDDLRCRQWIINSGNASLATLDLEELRKKFICENHFEESDYRPGKYRLFLHAVPKKYSDDTLHVITPTKVYTKQQGIFQTSESPNTVPSPEENSPARQQWLKDLTELPDNAEKRSFRRKLFEPTVSDTPRKKRLRQELIATRVKSTRKTKQISQLRKSVRTLKKSPVLQDVLSACSYPSESAKALVQMQLLHRNKTPWTKAERELSLAIYYKSPSTYRFLRKLKFVLPSVRTLRTWIGKSKCLPGISPLFLNQLRIKVETMSESERHCVACFDEVSLKEGLEYNKSLDLIEGFEDLGPLGRRPVLAKDALVFMVRGLYSSWKLPFAYYISAHGVKHQDLHKLIVDCVRQIQKAGLHPKATVCDEGTNNRSALRDLGVSIESPFFFVDEVKVYVIFDVPHLFKSLRNNMLNGNFMVNGKVVTFDDVRKTYDVDIKSKTGRSLLKITPAHLNPNAFQKMSCRLALQIFSSRMAAAMKTSISTGELTSATAIDTANFIDNLNRLFDALNSRTLYDANPYRCALGSKNEEVQDILLYNLNLFKDMKKLHFNGKETRPPCFDGIVSTISAILQLHQEQSTLGFSFLLTSRLNQDILENLFSIIRQKGGYNRNPTVRMFRTLIRHHTISTMQIPPESANCEADHDRYLLDKDDLQDLTHLCENNPQRRNTIITESTSSSQSSSTESETSTSSNTHRPSSSLEDCSIAYLAGGLMKRFLDKFHCANCEQMYCNSSITLDNKKQLLIYYRNYEKQVPQSKGLKAPSDLFRTVCKKALHSFNKWFAKYKCKRELAERILKEICREVGSSSLFRVDASECGKHRLFLLQLLVRIRIYNECKWHIMQSKSGVGSVKPHPKIRVLRHQ